MLYKYNKKVKKYNFGHEKLIQLNRLNQLNRLYR